LGGGRLARRAAAGRAFRLTPAHIVWAR
jgi:hypothetical protein